MILLLSGIPASRKTTFGRWLKVNRGFLHLDVEATGVLEGHGLRPEWDALFTHGAERLVARLNAVPSPTVIDWGFPPRCLAVVGALMQARVQPWWFDGDRDAARETFITRGTGSLADFDRQMMAIAANWQTIEDMFSPNLLRVVEHGPRYAEPTDIAEKIFGPV